MVGREEMLSRLDRDAESCARDCGSAENGLAGASPAPSRRVYFSAPSKASPDPHIDCLLLFTIFLPVLLSPSPKLTCCLELILKSNQYL